MANKKKKKPTNTISAADHRRALGVRITYLERRVLDLEQEAYRHWTYIDGLKQELRNTREAAQREAELRVQAESMVYRKLIHTLMADRRGVDMFLDRLSDLAPDIAKGVLVGTFEDAELVEGVRPNRADDSPSPL